MCVTTVSYNVYFNKSLVGPIQSSRGLREGGPLSLYLFLLCAEGLSQSLEEKSRNWLIHGCKISKGASHITHFLFADDNFYFLKQKLKKLML